MKKDALKKIIEDAYGPIEKGTFKLDTNEDARIKLTTLTLNGKTPYTPTTFMYNEMTPGMRHFILAGSGGTYDLEGDLRNHKIRDDYIVAFEPKIAPTEEDLRRSTTSEEDLRRKPHATYNISDISKVFERIQREPDIGLYRHEIVAPSSPHNSLCAVFIRMTDENGAPTALYLKRYFAASDHRTYQNVKYTINAFTPTKSGVSISSDNQDDQWPKNLLIFGAPGTGKSFAIDNKLRDPKWPNHAQRVTFYEDYSYEKFVGAYVPQKTAKSSEICGTIDSQSLCLKSTGDGIGYEFVPGPFLKMAADAWMDKHTQENTPHVLVIEEINRANAASVFGDMFQLLDRNSDGVSEYAITLSEEMREWLVRYLKKQFKKKDYGDDKEAQLQNADDWIDDFADHFKLPSNLYLWATMNSADQGVFPLDSAFKRRWSFLYKSVMDERTDNNKYLYTYVKDSEVPVFVSWDALRSAINDLMCSSENNIEEDRCIGAWYFKPAEMNQIFEYTQTTKSEAPLNMPNPLCDKLFHYLRQDVFRNNPGAIFKEGYHSMYKLREALAEGTPLLNVLNLPQDSLEEKYIIPANKMKFMVEAGKVDVSLDELADIANRAGVSFDKSIIFNMNNTCHTTYALNEDHQTKLIKETLDALQKGCSSPEAFEVLCKTFKDLPDAPNGNKEPEQDSSGVDGNSPADAPSNQATTSEATQEISQ